jgi:hypothetical protein
VATVGSETSARRAALAELIDHAALFPPASLAMPAALEEDGRVRRAGEGWLVGRFICPLSRLADVGDEPLRLSVVLDEAPDDRLDDPRVEAVEVPPGRGAAGLPAGLEVYVERPLGDLGWLDDLARPGMRAKVRCGGRSVPGVPELAAFVRRCRELGVAFKATAGLHHPIGSREEHGFLNLLAAAVFGEEEAVLADDDPRAFRLDDDVFAWREHAADASALRRVRERLFVGFGSCSVQEPVDDLTELGILGA